MIFLNGSLGFQRALLGKVKAFKFLEISPVSLWSCNKMLNAMPQWGPPTEPRLMTYCSEYSLFLAELNCPEWESELLIKPFFQGLGGWGRSSKRRGLVVCRSPYSHKLPRKHNGTRSNVSENRGNRGRQTLLCLETLPPKTL